MAEQWLSIVEYARTYAVSDMTIRRRIKTGRLKAVLKDGKYFIPVGPNGEIIENADTSKFVMPAAVSAELKIDVPTAHKVAKVFAPQDMGMGSLRPGASTKGLPTSISQALSQNDHSLVDTASLLQFCDNSLNRIGVMEKQLQETHSARLQALESQIKVKDMTIAQLRQQVEDLQILVKLMENR